MTKLLALLAGMPPWAVEGLLQLGAAIIKLIQAADDNSREEALMEAAEATKAALDAKKFGGTP